MAHFKMIWRYLKWWLLWNRINGFLSSNNARMNLISLINCSPLYFRWNWIYSIVGLIDGSFQNELTILKMMLYEIQLTVSCLQMMTCMNLNYLINCSSLSSRWNGIYGNVGFNDDSYEFKMNWRYLKWWPLWIWIDGILWSNNDPNELNFFNLCSYISSWWEMIKVKVLNKCNAL
jgi:hypothetical protein